MSETMSATTACLFSKSHARRRACARRDCWRNDRLSPLSRDRRRRRGQLVKSDFFLSRRGSVAEIAREVTDVLTERGYAVIVQDYDIALTANFIEGMHEAIKNVRDLIVLFTVDYETSPYTRKEFTSFEADRALGGEERLSRPRWDRRPERATATDYCRRRGTVPDAETAAAALRRRAAAHRKLHRAGCRPRPARRHSDRRRQARCDYPGLGKRRPSGSARDGRRRQNVARDRICLPLPRPLCRGGVVFGGEPRRSAY